MYFNQMLMRQKNQIKKKKRKSRTHKYVLDIDHDRVFSIQ